MRQIRGNRMSMIFQEPMTSLNPVMRIGDQITEAVRLHRAMKRRQAYKRGAPSLMRPEDFGIGQLFERVPDAIIVREAGSARFNPGACGTPRSRRPS